jgi:hypothetical protein
LLKHFREYWDKYTTGNLEPEAKISNDRGATK